jgi:glycosyltransferase involved in cell wall biosynthesis
MHKIAIIIPAYNEEKAIQAVVEDINALDLGENLILKVVVVNDCSTDSTSSIASELDCVVLDLPVNIGIGGAVQTGYKYAYDNDFDFAIQVDGDGQHPPSEISKLINTITGSNCDVVIGSRFINKFGFQSSFMRRTGIKFFKILLKVLSGIKINDPTSGFRILNRRALELVCNYYPDEYPEPEALIIYKYHHLSIIETPVEMEERKGGISSIRGFSGLYYMIKVSLAIFFTYIKLKFRKWKM